MSGAGLRVGVISLQGDVRENVEAAEAALESEAGGNGEVAEAASPGEIAGSDCLVIPGGESTAIGGMSLVSGAAAAVRERAGAGAPILGICAGLILLSRGASDRTVGATGQPLLDVLDVRVERNSFGRQRQSFEADVSMEPCGIPSTRGVFIRAPSVSEAGPGVEVLARHGGRIVAVRQGAVIGTAFHPELAGDLALYRHFIGGAAAARDGRRQR